MAATRTAPPMICKPDEHILMSCAACGVPKVAPMELFPFCSTKCRRTGAKQ